MFKPGLETAEGAVGIPVVKSIYEQLPNYDRDLGVPGPTGRQCPATEEDEEIEVHDLRMCHLLRAQHLHAFVSA